MSDWRLFDTAPASGSFLALRRDGVVETMHLFKSLYDGRTIWHAGTDRGRSFCDWTHWMPTPKAAA